MNETQAIIWERTGQHRPPLTGESFVGYDGRPDTALFDFTAQTFDILRVRRVPMKEVAHLGDPCKFCGMAHDDVSPGPCKGLCDFGVTLRE